MMRLLLFLCCPKGSPQGAAYFSDTFSPVCGINTCIIDQKRECCLTKASLCWPNTSLWWRSVRKCVPHYLKQTEVSNLCLFFHISPYISWKIKDALCNYLWLSPSVSVSIGVIVSVPPGPVRNGGFVTEPRVTLLRNTIWLQFTLTYGTVMQPSGRRVTGLWKSETKHAIIVWL